MVKKEYKYRNQINNINISFFIVFVCNCFKFSRIKSLKKLVDILEEDKHGPFVSIQPWLILIDGTVSTIFWMTVLCRTAHSFENSGKVINIFWAIMKLVLLQSSSSSSSSDSGSSSGSSDGDNSSDEQMSEDEIRSEPSVKRRPGGYKVCSPAEFTNHFQGSAIVKTKSLILTLAFHWTLIKNKTRHYWH